MTIRLSPLRSSVVTTGGVSVIVSTGPIAGLTIQNPLLAADQNVLTAETLWISLIGPADTHETATTFPINAGESWDNIPEDFSGLVSVNAVSSGHRFSGIITKEYVPDIPSEAEFPPAGPTVFSALIQSYLYEQYNDDDDLQTFVFQFNEMAEAYVDWFVNVGLPFYPGLQGSLLDWVALGLYGLVRPVLPSGRGQIHGPYNTVVYNTHAFNSFHLHGSSNYYLTDDDTFKRILTWHLYKGDGKRFDIRWLKRRIQRFLTGTDGLSDSVGETYPISVTFGPDGEVNINLQSIRRYATGGAIFNVAPFNGFAFNEYQTASLSIPISPMVPIFQAAMESGILETPFQFSFIVNVN